MVLSTSLPIFLGVGVGDGIGEMAGEGAADVGDDDASGGDDDKRVTDGEGTAAGAAGKSNVSEKRGVLLESTVLLLCDSSVGMLGEEAVEEGAE